MTTKQPIPPAPQVRYHVAIVGHTWGGFEASYDYYFDHEPTFEEIKRGAGDFQSGDDYEITRVERCNSQQGNKRVQTTSHEVIRPFAA